jgi:hypothetical protein
MCGGKPHMRVVLLCLIAFLLMGFAAYAEENKPAQDTISATAEAAPEAPADSASASDEEEVDPLAGVTDIESLKDIIREQKVEMLDMYSRLSALEAILSDTKKTQDSSWTQKAKLSGDLRYRYETIDQEGKNLRIRERIRTRIGLDATVTPELSLGFRLARSRQTKRSLIHLAARASAWTLPTLITMTLSEATASSAVR